MKKYRVLFFFLIITLIFTALYGCENAYKLSFSAEEYTVISGIEFVPEVNIKPKDTTYELTTSNITIAKVKDKTTIITLREGVVDITVTSGKKSATSKLYVSNDVEYDSNNVKFADTVNINFVITNYELAKLTTENYGMPMTIVKGGYAIFSSEPYLKGYIVHHWYIDRACSVKFDANMEINENMILYSYLEERETAYTVVNGLIAGLTYDNLAHSVLDLPETALDGSPIAGIADNAFYGDAQISIVNIPYSYKTIGDSAFAGCKNLTEINFTGGDSELEVIGINAFGVQTNDKDEEISSCEKLAIMELPDTVYEIGAFAFYKCSSLAFDDISPKVSVIKQYAFAHTKINNINFTNVTEILEGAFLNCPDLSIVSNTHNVTRCYKYAFDNSAIYKNAKSNYRTTVPQDDALAVFYADTIVIGVDEDFGYMYGTGDIVLKEECTLIADRAFYGANLKEITLYLTTQKANNILNDGSYNFLGAELMNISDGTNIVVPEDKITAYKTQYPNYKNIFCYSTIINVTDPTKVNYGSHEVFVFE
ncbi:MAG TPA: leucine-rich repeat domain-containing protein, partial [Clostridia bacterium]|nr:leucine-rich repeat domain-containing protein [Clostridia bacterium]